MSKKNKSNKWLKWVFIIAVIIGFVSMYNEPNAGTAGHNTTQVKEYATLQEAYNAHSNYIWQVCQEGLKLIAPKASNFEWPTYAGEYQGKFIIKGLSNGNLFRCEYIKYNNAWGMNLNDVKRE